MPPYSEDEMLQLSGIQHYVFCPRQWALIHLEQAWSDNRLTAEGTLLHENVDNPFLRETGSTGCITLRGLRLESRQLGLNGIADAVEIIPAAGAPRGKQALLQSKCYTALPVEYKRGRRKLSDCDRMQVAAQAMILEEMLGIAINTGAIFYWEERHREYIDISPRLRSAVKHVSEEMHQIFASRRLPSAVKEPHCKSCSLIDWCQPAISGKSAAKYVSDTITDLSNSSE